MMKKFLKFIFTTDYFKSFLLSFYYFPFKDAIKLPILVSYRTDIQCLSGGVKCSGKISTGMLMFGYNGLKIVDDRYDRTKWCLKGSIILKGKVRIGRGANLVVSKTATCVFGNNFTITGRSTIVCRNRIEFGADVLVSWDVLFMDTDYHPMLDSAGVVINKDKPIIVGDKVWIGCRVLILKGTVIPDGCIIAAGSTISGKLENSNTVYSSERKELKRDVFWLSSL